MLYHGYRSNEMIYDLYSKQVTELANLVKNRLNSGVENFKQQLQYDESKVKLLKENMGQELFVCPSTSAQFASGVIINCPVIKDNNSNKTCPYKQIIDTFDCDFIFVLDNERLYNDLIEKYNSTINTNIQTNNQNNQMTGLQIQETSSNYIPKKHKKIYS